MASSTDIHVRDAQASELEQLAKIWFDGWQDAHAALLPAELARIRTLTSFKRRLEVALVRVRVVGSEGAPVGLCMTKGSELHQLYVSAEARGSGHAAALMLDAESRLRQAGAQRAWLACAIGNERAARFYEKCGWMRVGIVREHLETDNGPFPLEVWRYEKSLG
jgi:ribosomal protein S18 acetylase RimI-like enzyme